MATLGLMAAVMAMMSGGILLLLFSAIPLASAQTPQVNPTLCPEPLGTIASQDPFAYLAPTFVNPGVALQFATAQACGWFCQDWGLAYFDWVPSNQNCFCHAAYLPAVDIAPTQVQRGFSLACTPNPLIGVGTTTSTQCNGGPRGGSSTETSAIACANTCRFFKYYEYRSDGNCFCFQFYQTGPCPAGVTGSVTGQSLLSLQPPPPPPPPPTPISLTLIGSGTGGRYTYELVNLSPVNVENPTFSCPSASISGLSRVCIVEPANSGLCYLPKVMRPNDRCQFTFSFDGPAPSLVFSGNPFAGSAFRFIPAGTSPANLASVACTVTQVEYEAPTGTQVTNYDYKCFVTNTSPTLRISNIRFNISPSFLFDVYGISFSGGNYVISGSIRPFNKGEFGFEVRNPGPVRISVAGLTTSW